MLGGYFSIVNHICLEVLKKYNLNNVTVTLCILRNGGPVKLNYGSKDNIKMSQIIGSWKLQRSTKIISIYYVYLLSFLCMCVCVY